MLSGDEQDAIAMTVANADVDELERYMLIEHERLVALSVQSRYGKLLPEDSREFEESVEMIIRIQGRFLGKGSFWRAIRRVKVAKHYLDGNRSIPEV